MALCKATRQKFRFRYTQLARWCVFYVRNGYSWRSLGSHMAAFHKMAEEEGLKWPKADSRTHRKLKRLITGIRKEVPGPEKKQAKPLVKRWIKKMLAALGIDTPEDWHTVRLADLVPAARMLVAQECLMRMCEHRDGMKVGDVVGWEEMCMGKADGRRAVVLRVPEVKDKLRTGQTRGGEMANHKSVTSAAWALRAMMARVHGPGAKAGDLLFPAVAENKVYKHTVGSETKFRKNLRAWAREAGMTRTEANRITTHSMRAGGATDYLSSDVPTAWVQRQGGWLSDCFMIYYRPETAEMGAMARRLRAAEARMLGE